MIASNEEDGLLTSAVTSPKLETKPVAPKTRPKPETRNPKPEPLHCLLSGPRSPLSRPLHHLASPPPLSRVQALHEQLNNSALANLLFNIALAERLATSDTRTEEEEEEERGHGEEGTEEEAAQ